MSEFIGSRISLISKSDIRYVGTLHEINSENSTVALEQVRSFGTEGRKLNAEEEIVGSDNVYEYIVFRGSDVKDLRIEEPPKENNPPPPPPQVPNDPAILGSGTRPPPNGASHMQPPFGGPRAPNFHQPPPPFPYQQYNQFPNQNFGGGLDSRFGGPPRGFHGYPGSPYGPGPGWHGPPPPPGHNFPGHPPPPFSPASEHARGPSQPPHGSEQSQGAPMPGHGIAPSNNDSKVRRNQAPPGMTASDSATGQSKPAEPSAASVGPPPPVDSKPDVSAAVAPSANTFANIAANNSTNTKGGRVIPAMPLTGPSVRKHKVKAPDPNANATDQVTAARPPQAATDAAMEQQNVTTQAATAAVAAAMAKLGAPSAVKSQPTADDQAMDNLTRKVNEMRTEEHARRGNLRASTRGRGRGRGGAGGSRGIEVPKSDFDFESANAKFNKQDLVKEAIASASPRAEDMNKSSPSGGGVNDPVDTQDVVVPPASRYDSKTSFFDNISSDIKERDRGSDNRRRPSGQDFRSEDRRKNLETFGIGSVDGGYRGRERGRGHRGYGRGRGGYRGGRGGNVSSASVAQARIGA